MKENNEKQSEKIISDYGRVARDIIKIIDSNKNTDKNSKKSKKGR